MTFCNPLTGPYRKANSAFLTEKANRIHDPRHIFYKAILSSSTYEQYYAKVGDIVVQPETFKTKPVNADMEIKYAKYRQWVESA